MTIAAGGLSEYDFPYWPLDDIGPRRRYDRFRALSRLRSGRA